MSHNNHHPGSSTTAPGLDPSTSPRNLTEPGPAATATLTLSSNNNQPPNNGATNSSPLHETYPCPYTGICGQLEAFSSGDALLEHIRATHLTRRESDVSGEPAAAAAAATAQAVGDEQDAFRQEELSEFSSLNSTTPLKRQDYVATTAHIQANDRLYARGKDARSLTPQIIA
ncbi:hypothetical protein HDU80_011140 [Chytriomyces hyalinus]|nr:hypothetical protein HDU80_011140 [Chytriomyces hyalinus]